MKKRRVGEGRGICAESATRTMYLKAIALAQIDEMGAAAPGTGCARAAKSIVALFDGKVEAGEIAPGGAMATIRLVRDTTRRPTASCKQAARSRCRDSPTMSAKSPGGRRT